MQLTDKILDDLIDKIAILELTGKSDTKLSQLRRQLIKIQSPTNFEIITPETSFGANDGVNKHTRTNDIPLVERQKTFDDVITQLEKINPEISSSIEDKTIN